MQNFLSTKDLKIRYLICSLFLSARLYPKKLRTWYNGHRRAGVEFLYICIPLNMTSSFCIPYDGFFEPNQPAFWIYSRNGYFEEETFLWVWLETKFWSTTSSRSVFIFLLVSDKNISYQVIGRYLCEDHHSILKDPNGK